MTIFQRYIVALLLAAILVAAWVFRYVVVFGSAGDTVPRAYLLDRWTGRVDFLLREESYRVRPGKE